MSAQKESSRPDESSLPRADSTVTTVLTIAGAVLLLSLAAPQWAKFLLTIALAKGLVVLGLLPQMRTGLVSFGQALYYCLGAYAAGLAAKWFAVSDLILMIFIGGSLAAVLALVVGVLLSRYRSIFYGLLSLALSMILYGLLVKTEALGSTDGFNVAPFTLFGYRPEQDSVRNVMLVVVTTIATVSALVIHRHLRTPLGRMTTAIRDNEIRLEYMGASARRVIYVNYVIGAVLAGIGGAIVAAAVGHIDPEMAYWTMSGEFVFMAILAGTASVLAPFLGAAIFSAIHSFAFDVSPNTWQMILGASLLLVIVFLPDGLWSLFRRAERS
jgi:branched-chain amino acid transport system permease protein